MTEHSHSKQIRPNWKLVGLGEINKIMNKEAKSCPILTHRFQVHILCNREKPGDVSVATSFLQGNIFLGNYFERSWQGSCSN
ncbi:hypothetical protein AV530_002306 [Patagioenas fasciata monilis]|uniref:Uncharacterized protein n=1 Tax=Patagioenas fasciata monilis TaxID=372326 RepID=A0A1V4K7H2_PATFA|nr:hypothetical protein AV530_002306 [Patagioenas fasciata monilis]